MAINIELRPEPVYYSRRHNSNSNRNRNSHSDQHHSGNDSRKMASLKSTFGSIKDTLRRSSDASKTDTSSGSPTRASRNPFRDRKSFLKSAMPPLGSKGSNINNATDSQTHQQNYPVSGLHQLASQTQALNLNASPEVSNDPPPMYSAVAPAGSVAGPSSATALTSAGSAPVTLPRAPTIDSLSRELFPESFDVSQTYHSSDGQVMYSPRDPYAFLRAIDTVFLIDDSGSMRGGRWDKVNVAMRNLTNTCVQYDANGIDLFFLNNSTTQPSHDSIMGSGYNSIKDPEEVDLLFEDMMPTGGTPTGKRLGQILDHYMRYYKRHKRDCKPINIIVITDGEANDPTLLKNNIIKTADVLDHLHAPEHQVGIQFVQVGDDAWAKDFLDTLDNGLGGFLGQRRDIVDTVSYRTKSGSAVRFDSHTILKICLGALIKKLDNKH